MRMLRSALLVAGLALMAAPVAAAPITIDFESLTDLESVTSQFAALGVTIEGGTALTSGAALGSLNELDFPPLSGVNVIFDFEGPIRVNFAGNGVSMAGGHFTYATDLTLTAFSGSTVLGTVTSVASTNILTLGGTTGENEAISFAAAVDQAITHIIISGSPSGASFTLDDFFAETIEGGGGGTDPNNPVPEPATVSLVLLGAAVAAGRQKLRARRQAHV
jgi:hypothetical protein